MEPYVDTQVSVIYVYKKFFQCQVSPYEYMTVYKITTTENYK